MVVVVSLGWLTFGMFVSPTACAFIHETVRPTRG
jgi:hypothetical protein